MKFHPASSMQLSWREWVRATGSVIDCGVRCEIHHPAGRTAKQDKVPIGHWYILPMTTSQHRMIDNGFAGLALLKSLLVGYDDRHADAVYDLSLHEFEKYLFTDILLDRLDKPFDDETLTAIERWHR